MAKEVQIVARPAGGDRLYRLVRDPDVRVDHFRSHRERSPRRPVPPGTPWLFIVGLSMFDTLDGALAVARRRPAWVAEVVLESGQGIHLARTLSKGHHTVWGEARTLVACITDVLEAP
jgi:hypothetical protein